MGVWRVACFSCSESPYDIVLSAMLLTSLRCEPQSALWADMRVHMYRS